MFSLISSNDAGGQNIKYRLSMFNFKPVSAPDQEIEINKLHDTKHKKWFQNPWVIIIPEGQKKT